MRTGRCSADAMLPSAGFGDHSALAHAKRKERLAERVVDLMGAGVVQVLALQPDLSTTAFFGNSLREIQRRRSTHIVFQKLGKLGLKGRILTRLVVFHCQFVERAYQRFGNVTSAKLAVAAGLIRYLRVC